MIIDLQAILVGVAVMAGMYISAAIGVVIGEWMKERGWL